MYSKIEMNRTTCAITNVEFVSQLELHLFDKCTDGTFCSTSKINENNMNISKATIGLKHNLNRLDK